MAESKQVLNRGVSRAILTHINRLPAGTAVTATNAGLVEAVHKELPGASEQVILSGLSYLKKIGTLESEVRGVYSKARSNGKAHPSPTDMELIVIDNLLNAMAEAEPVLKRCKKVIAALRDFQ